MGKQRKAGLYRRSHCFGRSPRGGGERTGDKIAENKPESNNTGKAQDTGQHKQQNLPQDIHDPHELVCGQQGKLTDSIGTQGIQLRSASSSAMNVKATDQDFRAVAKHFENSELWKHLLFGHAAIQLLTLLTMQQGHSQPVENLTLRRHQRARTVTADDPDEHAWPP